LGDEGPRQRLSGRCLNDHAASCPPLMPPAREKRKSGPGVPSPRRSPTSSSLPEGIPPTERKVKKNSIIRWLTRSAGSVAARPLFLLLGLDRPPLRHVVVVLGQRGRKDMAARAVGDEEEVVGRLGVQRRGDALAARVGDGRRRQPVDDIGVVGRPPPELAL